MCEITQVFVDSVQVSVLAAGKGVLVLGKQLQMQALATVASQF